MVRYDKTVLIWLILSAILFIVFFTIFNVIIGFQFIGCFFTAISTVIFSYLILLAIEKINTDNDVEFFSDREQTSKERKDVKNIGKKKKSSFLDKLTGGKTCNTCGTELVYKEEMDSYYCPECHEYK